MPVEGHTIDYRADCASEDGRSSSEDVRARWASWSEGSEERAIRYFIPDWDDLVDPQYDFVEERYGNATTPGDRGSGGWDHEVFAHQFYDTPAYDGLLVSREVIKKSKRKRDALRSLAGRGGVHRYLRVPPSFPVMGDCGAFGYVKEKVPPYSVEDVLDYYSRHGFDYGISVDHLVIGASGDDEKQFRYDLTLENAQAFWTQHQRRGLPWTPMAAVQGWDETSYAEAAQACVAMGYNYLAIGGLVRSSTDDVVSTLQSIRDAIGPGVQIHALGVARLEAIDAFLRLGITSMDSATYLRRAWMSQKDNYWAPDGTIYTAIRVPGPKRALRAYARRKAKQEVRQRLDEEPGGRGLSAQERARLVEDIEARWHAEIVETRLDRARELEKACFEDLRTFGARAASAPSLSTLLNRLEHYHQYLGRACLRDRYWQTLSARPWETCGCAVCEDAGIEVIIFRGNNRNRRRGFHNTRVFYDVLGQKLSTYASSSAAPNARPSGGISEPRQHGLFM
jgi:hypothetical protein